MDRDGYFQKKDIKRIIRQMSKCDRNNSNYSIELSNEIGKILLIDTLAINLNIDPMIYTSSQIISIKEFLRKRPNLNNTIIEGYKSLAEDVLILLLNNTRKIYEEYSKKLIIHAFREIEHDLFYLWGAVFTVMAIVEEVKIKEAGILVKQLYALFNEYILRIKTHNSDSINIPTEKDFEDIYHIMYPFAKYYAKNLRFLDDDDIDRYKVRCQAFVDILTDLDKKIDIDNLESIYEGKDLLKKWSGMSSFEKIEEALKHHSIPREIELKSIEVFFLINNDIEKFREIEECDNRLYVTRMHLLIDGLGRWVPVLHFKTKKGFETLTMEFNDIRHLLCDHLGQDQSVLHKQIAMRQLFNAKYLTMIQKMDGELDDLEKHIERINNSLFSLMYYKFISFEMERLINELENKVKSKTLFEEMLHLASQNSQELDWLIIRKKFEQFFLKKYHFYVPIQYTYQLWNNNTKNRLERLNYILYKLSNYIDNNWHENYRNMIGIKDFHFTGDSSVDDYILNNLVSFLEIVGPSNYDYYSQIDFPDALEAFLTIITRVSNDIRLSMTSFSVNYLLASLGNEFLKEKSIVADVCAGVSGTLSRLFRNDDNGKISKIIGIDIHRSAILLSQMAFHMLRINPSDCEFFERDALLPFVGTNHLQKVDLIVSDLPNRYRNNPSYQYFYYRNMDREDKSVYRDLKIIVNALNLLKKDGIGIFVCDSIAFRRRNTDAPEIVLEKRLIEQQKIKYICKLPNNVCYGHDRKYIIIVDNNGSDSVKYLDLKMFAN